MKSPRTLRKGDLISLVAPAKKLDSETLEFATRFLESNGFRVERGPNSLNSFNQFSGTDEERLSDFQQALDNPEVKAIICLRGGYGSMRIIDRLDWKTFRKKPKWICGFSDITTFHSYCHQVLETQSLHCSMPLNFEANSAEALESLVAALKGKELVYDLQSHENNRPGIASAAIVGGNLSILSALRGTDLQIDLRHKILFIEEVGESLYHVDRMLETLRLSGELESLAGLIIGGMTQIEDKGDWFGTQKLNSIILEKVRPYNFPVVFDFPAGHIDDNRAIIFGKDASLAVGDGVHLRI